MLVAYSEFLSGGKRAICKESGRGGLLYLDFLKLIPWMEFGYLILRSHQKKET